MAEKTRKILSSFAVFDSAPEGGYNVSFPEFPGCVTFGKTFEEAEKKAKEILELWLEEMASQKQKIRIRSKSFIISEIKAVLPQKTL